MVTFVGILLFVLCLSVHELGHALAMRKHGVKMSEICLFGLGGFKAFSFKLPKIFGDTPLTFRPLIPLGAFVRPDGDISALERKHQVEILAAGVAANYGFAFSMLFVVYAFTLNFKGLWVLLIVSASVFLLLRFAKVAFVIGTGAAMLLLVVYSLVKDLSSAGSIVSIVGIISQQSTFVGVVKLCAFISLSMALLNCAPLFGLAGHKIPNLYLPERVKTVTDVVALVGILALLLVSLGGDVFYIFRK